MRWFWGFYSNIRSIGRCRSQGMGTTYSGFFGGHIVMFCGKPKGHTDRHGQWHVRGYR